MKVTLISENEGLDNPIEHVLSNRGVKDEDMEKYLHPTSELMPDYNKLKNIEKGIDLLAKHIENGSKIGVSTDVDVDGLSSTSVAYRYIKYHLGHDNVDIIAPKGKFHGILIEESLNTLQDGGLLIVPDAGSSDFEAHEIMKDNKIDVLILDHHLAPDKETSAVIINNQLSPDFPNKALTGSAITYLFCLAYADKFGLKQPTDLIDMCASGLVADRADFSTDLGAYYLMREGLKKENIKSKLLKTVIDKDSNLEDTRNLTAKDIGFNVAPLFNAAIRVGTPEEVLQVTHAFCEFDYTLYNSRKKIEQHIVEEGYLRASAAKRRQKKIEDTALEQIKERITEKNIDSQKVMIINTTGIVTDSGMNGLIAMKIASEFKRPVLMVQVVDDMFKGSGRNINNSPIEDLNAFLTETGLITCQGHANAFGVSFKIDDAMDVFTTLADKAKDIDFDDSEYEVDFQWNNLQVDVLHDLADNSELWCNGIDEPLIHIKDKVIPKDSIELIGKAGNTLKVTVNGISCLKFRLSEHQQHEIATASDNIKINIVGTAGMNTYRGMNTPQIMIKDYTIENGETADLIEGLSMDELPF